MDEDSVAAKATHIAGVFIGSVAILAFMVIVILSAAVLNGFVLQIMWKWFVVPLGLPALGLAHAVGFGFFIRYLTWQHQPPIESEDESKANIRRLVTGFVYPFIILGLGAAAHAFM